MMAKTDGSFLKSFVPGLVIGTIIGASAAVFLPETLNRPSVATGNAGPTSGMTPRNSDASNGLGREWEERPGEMIDDRGNGDGGDPDSPGAADGDSAG